MIRIIRTSQEYTLTCGIPQGTVLGPLLFNVYLNKLFSLKVEDQIRGFADDTAIFYEETSWTYLKNTVYKDSTIIFGSFRSILLTETFYKSCLLLRMLKYTSLSMNLKPETIVITSVQNFKYLGIYLDIHSK